MEGVTGLSYFTSFQIYSNHFVGNPIIVSWFGASTNNVENVYKKEREVKQFRWLIH